MKEDLIDQEVLNDGKEIMMRIEVVVENLKEILIEIEMILNEGVIAGLEEEEEEEVDMEEEEEVKMMVTSMKKLKK